MAKPERSSKLEGLKFEAIAPLVSGFEDSNLGDSNLFRVSDLELRICIISITQVPN
jgi:hypothetical protein